MLLAIDTSTAIASIALYNDTGVLLETTWHAGREHSTRVMAEVDRALQLLGRTPADLTALAAARGPGSFTGVRVGVALARGLAFALQLPAYGVCSLDPLAASQAFSERPVRPLLDAGRSRFATALYEPAGHSVQRVGEIEGVDLEGLIALVDRSTLLCGELPHPARQAVLDRLGSLATVASPAAGLRRAGYLAELSWRRFQGGEEPDPEELEPIYLSKHN